MKNYVLEVSGVTFSYDNTNFIYKDFDLNLSRGEVISVVGASGSGKSTLFELITNNLKPQTGTIKSLRLSSIYQDPYSSFHNTYTIYEQIKDVANDLEEIDSLLEKVSIAKELLYKKPYELSGGQLQRCSIVRAILMQPDVLLADEPTSALDNVIALDVMQMLMQFLDRFGILLITHDMELARWCSDKIIKIGEI